MKYLYFFKTVFFSLLIFNTLLSSPNSGFGFSGKIGTNKFKTIYEPIDPISNSYISGEIGLSYIRGKNNITIGGGICNDPFNYEMLTIHLLGHISYQRYNILKSIFKSDKLNMFNISPLIIMEYNLLGQRLNESYDGDINSFRLGSVIYYTGVDDSPFKPFVEFSFPLNKSINSSKIALGFISEFSFGSENKRFKDF